MVLARDIDTIVPGAITQAGLMTVAGKRSDDASGADRHSRARRNGDIAIFLITDVAHSIFCAHTCHLPRAQNRQRIPGRGPAGNNSNFS